MIQTGIREMNNSNSSTYTGWHSSANTFHAAGITKHFVGYTHYQESESTIDPSATDDITPHINLLADKQEFNSILHLSNGNTAAITHIGKIILYNNIILENVLCAHFQLQFATYTKA